ncbi:MAG: glutathione S-transferase family protein [Polyangiaceae bacterium]|nr:glutathione S-transferase family protein [Polyangiaceae bacterium]
MKLYSLPLSPYAARVRAAIYAKGLPVELIMPPEGWSTSTEYRAINPLGKVPALVLDDGTAIVESGVIVEYLEDAHPEPSLRPRNPEALARVRLVAQVAELYVMGAMNPLFLLFDAKEKDMNAIEAQLAKLDAALGHLDAMLPEKGLAHGDRVTIADACLTPVRFALDGLMGFSGRKGLLDGHARVAGYRDALQGHPALARVWQEMTDGLKAFYQRRAAV